MASDPVRSLVQGGYDEIAKEFLDVRVRDGVDVTQLADLQQRLGRRSRILDAGSGPSRGSPMQRTEIVSVVDSSVKVDAGSAACPGSGRSVAIVLSVGQAQVGLGLSCPAA